MAFLLFAARKLQLKRELNTKNYELMLITQQYNQATTNVADFQQTMSNMQQMTSVFTSGLQNLATSQAMAQAFGSNSNQYQAIMSGNTGSLSQADLSKAQAAAQLGTMAATQVASAIGSVSESIFNAANKAQLAKLQAQQQNLDLRKASLESQVQVLSAEYNSVKEAEGQEAKSIAPQFGLA